MPVLSRPLAARNTNSRLCVPPQMQQRRRERPSRAGGDQPSTSASDAVLRCSGFYVSLCMLLGRQCLGHEYLCRCQYHIAKGLCASLRLASLRRW